MAHAEVYILNYNGAHHLGPCLEALSRVELGGHTLGVNVVDNGSSDNSEHTLAAHGEIVRWLANVALRAPCQAMVKSACKPAGR